MRVIEIVKAYGHPQIKGRFEIVGPVQDLFRGGTWVEPYELETGHIVQIPRFRASEAEGTSGDDLREWDTTFMLVGLRYNHDRHIATLVPEGETDELARVISFARRFHEEEEEEELAKRDEVIGM